MYKQLLFYILFIIVSQRAQQSIATAHNNSNQNPLCRNEIEKICPQKRYNTLMEQRQCITANLIVFSQTCQEYLTSKHKVSNYLSQSNSTPSLQQTSDSKDILTKCQADMERFCETKTKDNQVIAKHKKKCIKTLKQHKTSMLSSMCLQAINASKGKSQAQQERKELRNQRKINHSQTRATFGSIVVQTPTGTITGYQIPIHQSKHSHTAQIQQQSKKHLKNNKTSILSTSITTQQPITHTTNILIPDGTDRLEFEDNGNENGGYIVLSNGREIRQSQMNRFTAKYRDYMKAMSEEGQNILINKYFPNTKPDAELTLSDEEEVVVNE